MPVPITRAPSPSIVAVLSAVLVLSACGDDPTLPEESLYLPADSPENVLTNFVTSYRERDIEAYGKLLHPEFRFRLQSSDALDFGELCPEDPCFFDRETDSLGTHALFRADEVRSIELVIVPGPQEPVDLIDFPPGGRKIRTEQVLLYVNQTDGLTFRIIDPQDFFFLPDPADTTGWLLYEWHDNPVGLGEISHPLSEPSTWGALKKTY